MLFRSNPDTVQEELRKLILDPAYRTRKSSEGRKYVEKYHDALVVAREMLDIYRLVGLK